jgi:hypothetical protein
MKDERIQTTVNRFATIGFLICFYLLLPISIVYRTLILKQHPRQWWDIFAIWIIGLLFVFIAYATKGVFAHGFKRFWLTIFIGVFIVNLTLFFIMGQIHSVVDVGLYLIGFLPAMGLVIAIAYFLNRRWERKEGIENEK